MKPKLNIISILLFVIVLFACKGNKTNEIKVFIKKYIETVSIEHEKHKINITDKMIEYFYDDENKENGEYVRDVEYWVVLVNNKFYIYADNTLNDIYILEKDLEN